MRIQVVPDKIARGQKRFNIFKTSRARPLNYSLNSFWTWLNKARPSHRAQDCDRGLSKAALREFKTNVALDRSLEDLFQASQVYVELRIQTRRKVSGAQTAIVHEKLQQCFGIRWHVIFTILETSLHRILVVSRAISDAKRAHKPLPQSSARRNGQKLACSFCCVHLVKTCKGVEDRFPCFRCQFSDHMSTIIYDNRQRFRRSI